MKNLFKDFNINLPGISKTFVSEQELCELLNTSPDALKAFEESYSQLNKKAGLSDNIFKINSRQMADIKSGIQTDVPTEIQPMVERIVADLISQTVLYVYDGEKQAVYEFNNSLQDSTSVSLDEIKTLPKEFQPDLTRNAMKRDVPDSGKNLIDTWAHYKKEKNPKKKKRFYDIFRQGLDLLDLDPLTYKIIDQNPISMGYWLPCIVDAVNSNGFFKIPPTKIIKVPITVLQLTRQEYPTLSRTTLDIVDEYCNKVFGLVPDGDYFIKTGTFSSKFDFRNARVNSPKEIKELGEYLLFIHWQALQMAHFDLSGRNQPIIYGVSTTTEWVVRDFIPDKEENLTIYHGLPLHTEYRVFVDFDTDEVLGIHPYWDEKVMKRHFEQTAATDPDAFHDHITFSANEARLKERYEANKDCVVDHLREILPDINLPGQWSVDIMQNGDDFWIIDMATAERSAYYDETVPEELKCPTEENWLPDLGKTE